MQRIGESGWRLLELCWWPDHAALTPKGKEYPGLGYKRLRDKAPKAQQQQQPGAPQLYMVFAECGIGAIVLTFNAILLGGEIVFFQALCLLGYCLFPICVSSIVCAIVGNKIVRTLALVLGLAWASFATVPFIGSAVPMGRKALAVYPVILLYASIGWVALVKAI
ncbi:hypothetical protein QJQ45_003405 [Haematococcus lacustris]|nr:hypothetical protein QJQ45_003405 [Haematococcus lacustris]